MNDSTGHPERESDVAHDQLIAVVGMAAHLPGARDVEQFWANLREGVESIRHFSDEELEAAAVPGALIRDPKYVKANGVLEKMEWFDAGFFGLSPRDAAIMDPQARHFLECAWQALENGGHLPESFEGNIGVFAGAGANQYFWKNIVPNPELMESVGYFLLRHTGNDKDFLSTRASYEFDLKGPSVGVQTACSTSLVAIHYACQSLLSWECDMALAGGVTIEQPHHVGYLYEEGEILSPDGHCRSFDARAEGTVFGSGVGVVVLRRLSDALADGDTVHAVIRGSAVNNDGAGKVSYLAPSVDGQAKAVAEALSVAGVDPSTIGLVEGHGTATPVGDPIEVSALTQAFRAHTDEVGYCALGSVKSNIGHLDTAAGVASFIKAVLALKHAEIPPTVHFEQPNPLLELETSPFYVNAEVRPWPRGSSPLRAVVNSLGVGGTNAHVVLEEAPSPVPSGPSRPWQLLTLSGRSATVLEDATGNLVDFLETESTVGLPDVSYTLRHGRRRFDHRRAVVCSSREEAVDTLSLGQGPWLTNVTDSRDRREVAFLFAGGGAQYPHMGRELYQNEGMFREIVDECLEYLQARESLDLRPELFPGEGREEEAAFRLQRPSLALPALFTIQYAQARLWMSWGIAPSSMIGHSMGEYTAACLAGVFSMEDALSLVALRGRLFESLSPGAMLSVNADEGALGPFLAEDLSIAAINAPEVIVAAGPVPSIERLEEQLQAADIDCRRVRIDVAAHSSMLEEILEPFREYLQSRSLSAPTMPMISNLTGEVAGPELATADYWVKHLRETVQFSKGIRKLVRPDGPVFLEVGPGRTLATLVKMQPGWTPEQPSLSSLPHPTEPGDAQAFQLASLGALWAHGVDPDWAGFDGSEQRGRIPLPTYPFEREPYFVAPPSPTEAAAAEVKPSQRSADLADWFQQVSWEPTPLPEAPAPGVDHPTALVLSDAGGLGDALADRLERAGHGVVRVRRGTSFGGGRAETYALRPGDPSDWRALVDSLQAERALPGLIVHAWCLEEEDGDPEEIDTVLNDAFFAPLHLLQALESATPGHAATLVAVTTGVAAVSGDERLSPGRATLLGPIRVSPREIPSVRTRLIDVGTIPEHPVRTARLLDQLLNEVVSTSDDTLVAYRGPKRLAERFTNVPVGEGTVGGGLRERGVYLITGGLGGIGLVVARELAEAAQARLVLLGRTGLPPRAEWSSWLAAHPDTDKTARAIREVQALEALGAEVLVLAADVTETEQVQKAITVTLDRFDALHGVIHAAGVLDDGPLLGRDRDQIRRVLDPKVRGALALDAALQGVSLDFFFLFSSVSAVLGAPGQIDYASANAFLDAFAYARSEATGGRVVSMAWGAWKDVGMAAELAGETRYDRSADGADQDDLQTQEHPLFDAQVTRMDGERAFRTRFTKDRHWMMTEHRVRDGGWVLPGSGYVELIRAAAREVQPETPFQLEDLVFLQPFGVDDEEVRELEISFSPNGKGWSVAVQGRGEGALDWTEHATARVANEDSGPSDARTLDEVVGEVGVPARVERPTHPVMDFGPRWGNVTDSATLDGQALLVHELQPEFAGDFESVELHPALLDMATAGAQHLIPGVDPATDFFVPAGYGSLRMRAPLGAQLTSHVTLRHAESDGTMASFDITIYDPSGNVSVTVRDFSMIRISNDAFSAGGAAGSPDWLRDAIAPHEGRDALRRVLSHATAPHLLIATRSVGALVADLDRVPVKPARAAASRKGPSRGALPEVAGALESHASVKEAVALGDLGDAEAARVVAFVAYEPGAHATVSELRRFVRESLAGGLVPQNFVEMVALPRGSTGEVLIDELRDPFAVTDDFIAPRSASEEAIASIWSELLGLDRVGIHDNFLDVGGHSLVGIRVLLRIQQATGVRLEANALTMQTLEQLAADIDRLGGNVSPPTPKAAEAAPTSPSASPPAAGDAVAEEEPSSATGGILSRMRKAFSDR